MLFKDSMLCPKLQMQDGLWFGDYSLYVFYQNGLVFTPGATYDTNEDFHIFRDTEYLKRHWGLFIIDKDIIQIEEYKVSMIEGMPAYIKFGTILNDTTFVLEEERRSNDGSEYSRINEVYHFKQFSPKPDSTNNFIK